MDSDIDGFSDTVVSLEELEQESVVDDITQEVVQFVQKGWPLRMTDESLQPYYHVRSELSLGGKDLKCLVRGQRVIMPQKLRQKVLGIAHEGHLGMVRMKQRCREVVWSPGMAKQVENWVTDSEACLLSGKSVRPRVAPLQPVQWPAGPWDRIQINVFGELHAGPYSQRFMIVVHDLFSKWPEVQVMQNVTTVTVIDFLQSLFAR